MEKKVYFSPAIEIANVEAESLICASIKAGSVSDWDSTPDDQKPAADDDGSIWID